jgi:N-methylhydantoinase A
MDAMLVHLKTSIIGKRADIGSGLLQDERERAPSLRFAQTGERSAWFTGGWQSVPVYRRALLPEAAQLNGPAIIEQLDTTILIEPGDTVRNDRWDNLIVKVGA